MVTLSSGSIYTSVLALNYHLVHSVPLWLDKLVAASFICAHSSYLLLAHLLAFNRFILMAARGYSSALFNGFRIWIWIIAILSAGLLMLAVYMTPYAGLRYFPEFNVFAHPTVFPWNHGMLTLLRYMLIVNLSGMMFWYALIVMYIACKRKSVRQNASKKWKKEATISLQAFIIGGMLLQCWSLWLTISFLGYRLHTLCVVDCTLLAGMNAPIYLIFNHTIRRKYLKLFGFKSLKGNSKLSTHETTSLSQRL